MNLKQILIVCLAAIFIPAGMVLLLPLAARAFGGIVAGIRAQLIVVGLIGWLVYRHMMQADRPDVVSHGL